MKITEAMRRTGLSRKAIYVYEDRGLLIPSKGAMGYRDYSEADVERLLLIAKLRELDLPLEDIARILQRPDETDILIQKHLEHMQKHLHDTVQKLSQLQTILYNLPPNGQLDDFARATEIAIPAGKAIAAARHLSEDTAVSYARRLTMHLFEAFLDLPLDTPERWSAWYDLLDLVERAGVQLWDGFEEYYGGMTAEQKYQDYLLRRKLVVGYTTFTPDQEAEKAREILSCLKRLADDPGYAHRWARYYRQVAAPSLYAGSPSLTPTEQLAVLSRVYLPYMAESRKLICSSVLPYLDTEEGQTLRGRLQSALGSAYDLSVQALNYFDFYNNTLEKAPS